MSAACASGIVPADWFAVDATQDQMVRARQVCKACVLRASCYAEGVAERLSGMYGGVPLIEGRHRQRAAPRGDVRFRAARARVLAEAAVAQPRALDGLVPVRENVPAVAEAARVWASVRWADSAQVVAERLDVLYAMAEKRVAA